jgi:aspartokinase/homoserine dehydrogenase 1
MRVLKFGGTSVANAERFLRVADILESNARQGQVATVLSAPAKITNHLVAMIEKTIGGQDALPNISDAERIFAELLQGLAEAQPGFPLAQLKPSLSKSLRRSNMSCTVSACWASARTASTRR